MARCTTAGTDVFTTAARDIAISDDGTVATRGSGSSGNWKGVTGGEVLVAGTGKKDYWEVTLTADLDGDRDVVIGVMRYAGVVLLTKLALVLSYSSVIIDGTDQSLMQYSPIRDIIRSMYTYSHRYTCTGSHTNVRA